jgi:hypothetical protein
MTLAPRTIPRDLPRIMRERIFTWHPPSDGRATPRPGRCRWVIGLATLAIGTKQTSLRYLTMSAFGD